jgi:hypothetical protein
VVTAADILERAAELGDTDGWCQGVLKDPDTDARCAIGLIQAAGRELGLFGGRRTDAPDTHARALVFCDALHAVNGQIRARRRVDAVTISVWNDTKGRTWPEVRDALLHAAKETRNDAC